MASDRARISFDPSRQWRGVISQQGRVTLEADWNEGDAIAAAARRGELLEVVGPCGTPDDGYGILVGEQGQQPGDITIEQGTMYVGGERVVVEANVDYSSQPEWIDTAGDQLWVAPAVPDGEARELVYLLLREQEVGAVEDPALLDVALGGPDTSARRRIVQRVVRAGTEASDCSHALSGLETAWTSEGLEFDPATMRLDSLSTLQVSFSQQQAAPTPCAPAGTGGYLGAENQLIRVQVASVDEHGVPSLLWGFDNASSLYRIASEVVDTAGGTTTLKLSNAPVDSYHQPAAGQAVEVLQAAAKLTDSDYMAATSGIATTLTSDYAPDTGQLEIATALAAETTSSPLLFLRVWQELLVYSGPGPLALGETGLEVTLSASDGVYHVGDYWTFAVRPGTPSSVSPVYPQRILEAPQPPDGPSLWACQLGILAWSGGTASVSDCRYHFQSLVTLTEESGGCCTVAVGPADVDGGATLQALIDAYAAQSSTTICLQPGTYTLPEPLKISASMNALTIEACAGGVLLQAPANPSEEFLLGLIVATGAPQLTLRGLKLALPLVPFTFSAPAIAGLPQEQQPLLSAYGNGLLVAIGASLLGGAELAVEDCTFSFPEAPGTNVFGAGLFATGAIEEIAARNCDFLCSEPASAPFSALRVGEQSNPPYQVRCGYLQVPTQAPPPLRLPPIDVAGKLAPQLITGALAARSRTPVARTEEAVLGPLRPSAPIAPAEPIGPARPVAPAQPVKTINPAEPIRPIEPLQPITTAPAEPVGPVEPIRPIDPIGPLRPIEPIKPAEPTPEATESVPLTTPVLTDATFERNVFDGVTVPILAVGEVGATRVAENSVRGCYGGFWFVVAEGETVLTLIDRLDSSNSTLTGFLASGGLGALADPVLLLATVIGRLLPKQPPTPGTPLKIGSVGLPSASSLGAAASLLGRLSATLAISAAGPIAGSPSVAEDVQAQTPKKPASRAKTTRAKASGAKATRTRVAREAISEPIAASPILATLPAGIAGIFTHPGIVDVADLVPPAPTGTGALPRLDVHTNEVDAIVADAYSGAGLLIAVSLADATIVSSVLCTANRIRSRVASGATVAINGVSECTVVGNILSNEIVAPSVVTVAAAPSNVNKSLLLAPATPPQGAAPVAVTGNVLLGPATLPPRTLAAPFEAWDPLNTITPYLAPAAATPS